MLTIINGVADATGKAELKFDADRVYNIYAMEGIVLNGAANIELGYASAPAPDIGDACIALSRRLLIAGAGWTGQFVMLANDILFMRVTQAVAGNKLVFKILLMPVAKLAAELAAEGKR